MRQNPPSPEAVARGERVLAVRKALDLKQKDMAARAGIEREHLSAIENGVNRATSYDVRCGLARAVGVPTETFVEYLVGRIELDELLGHRVDGAA